VMALTMAWCDRELSCDHIGLGRLHTDQTSCLETLGHVADREIGSRDCPMGVQDKALVNCLAEVQSQPCSDKQPILASCRRAALCR
jgi:hypothetical protein